MLMEAGQRPGLARIVAGQQLTPARIAVAVVVAAAAVVAGKPDPARVAVAQRLHLARIRHQDRTLGPGVQAGAALGNPELARAFVRGEEEAASDWHAAAFVRLAIGRPVVVEAAARMPATMVAVQVLAAVVGAADVIGPLATAALAGKQAREISAQTPTQRLHPVGVWWSKRAWFHSLVFPRTRAREQMEAGALAPLVGEPYAGALVHVSVSVVVVAVVVADMLCWSPVSSRPVRYRSQSPVVHPRRLRGGKIYNRVGGCLFYV